MKQSLHTDPGRETTIVIAHDWLVRYAGSERVVEQLLVAFPGSRLVTTIVDGQRLPASLASAEASFLGRLPGSRSHHEWYLPLMPLSWRVRSPLTGVDAVVASSHACAHAVRVADGIPLISYCHTPMRYAWDFEAEAERFPRFARQSVRLAMGRFRRWDGTMARRVTQFVANSTAVASRISRFYGRSAVVVHPPVRTEYFIPGGERGERFLYVGRLTGYKRPDLVIEAFRDLPFELDVVGEGSLAVELRRVAPPNVRFLGAIADEALRDLYQTTRALVYPVQEDFGIAMAEAQSCGAPVLGLAAGGALDIVEPGVTGWLVGTQDVRDVRVALRRAAAEDLSPEEIRSSALRFSEARFRAAMADVVASVSSSASRSRS